MTAIIQVVSALILDADGRMLMTYRSATTKRPLMWEHPGGKVEPHETDRDALVRELHEELGVSAIVGKLVSQTRLDVEVTLELRLYAVTIIGEPRPSCDAVDSIEYVSLWDAIQHRPCAPATYGYCRDIERHLANRDKPATEDVIAEAVYDVLRQHDNESIQEVDWRQLAGQIGARAAEKLGAKS